MIVLVVANDRLNSITTLEQLLQCATGFVLPRDMNFDIRRMMLFTTVATVNSGLFRANPGQSLNLINCRLECRAVIRIVMMRLDANDPIAL